MPTQDFCINCNPEQGKTILVDNGKCSVCDRPIPTPLTMPTQMTGDKIYYTLKEGEDTLSAYYRGRYSKVAISLVPEVMKNSDHMLFEEQVIAAEKYLKNIMGI